jgi:outer membrane biosynthesis protein TonB
MRRRSLIVLVALLCAGSMRAAAQEAHPPQPADPGRPTHGIIRKPQPKPPAESAKAATTEPGKPDAPKAEAEKASGHERPAASTEAVAAAIANAVRSLEEKDKKKADSAHPLPPRPARPAAPRAVAQRRYSVTWPSQRFEVQWDAPVDRVVLSWGALETTAERSRDDLRLEP